MDSWLIASASVLLLLTLINHCARWDWLYPGTLQSGLWTCVLFSYLLRSDGPTLSSSSLVAVLEFSLLFSFGSYLGSLGSAEMRSTTAAAPGAIDRAFLGGTLLAATVGLPFFALRAWELSFHSFSDNPLMNIRYSIALEGKDYGLLAYLVPASVMATAICIFFSRYINGFLTGASITVAITYGVLWTGRTFLFLVVLLILGTLALQRRISARRASLAFLSMGLLFFVVMGLALGKGGSFYDDFLDNALTMTSSLLEYYLAPLAAFDQFLRSDQNLSWGSNTFRTFFAILAAFRVDHITVVPLVKEFVYVPLPMNVYTVLQPYYSDFGDAGVIVAGLILGAGHGYIYKRARQRDVVWSITFGLALFPLFMQFFQDQYFSLASNWLQYALLLGLYAFFRHQAFVGLERTGQRSMSTS
jgi:oligosaccharide repeat unit polymerase